MTAPQPISRRRRVTRALGASLLVVALPLTGCAGTGDDTDADGAADTVKFALLLPLTGGSQATGEAMLAAAQLTVDDINAAGGVLGREVELIVADDACDPQTAVMAANDLVADGVVASVGGYCSSAVVPTLSIFDAASVPMIIPAANSTDLLAPGYEGVFLLSPVVAAEAELAVPWLADLGAASAVFVHDGTSFPLTLAESADATAQASGEVASLGLLEIAQGSEDLTGIAAQVVASGADSVYFTGYEPDAVELAASLDEVGYTGLFVVGDGAVGSDLLEQAPAALGRSVYATMPPVAEFGDDEQLAWATDLLARTGTDALPYTMQAADAVTMAVDAVRRAGTDDPAAVRTALASASGVDLLTADGSFGSDHVLAGVVYSLLDASPTGTTVRDRRAPGEAAAP